MKKYISLLLALIMCISLFGACAVDKSPDTPPQNTSQPTEKTAVNIAVLKGPTGMGCSELLKKNAEGSALNDYNFTIAGSPDQITGKLVSGELDIAALPTNAVSALYNKTKGGVTLIALNTRGVLYILERGDSVETVTDLKGKTVLASGKGSTAEYVLNYILEKNGIEPDKDITIDYAAEHTEAASQALSGKYDIVMLPEPFVTSVTAQNADFKVKINLTEEWKKLGAGELSMGAIAVRTAFLNENKAAVDSFLKEYADSVAFTNNNIEEASAIIEEYDIAKAAVAQKAIPNCNIVYIDGEEMKSNAESFLKIIAEADPSSVGGTLPDSAFYYINE